MQTWEVIRPRVFRYLEAKYVDAFFKDGFLRLSSFSRFAQHADEQRKDASEGMGVREGIGENAHVIMATGRGHDCYVLCGSTIYNEAAQELFPDADACFAIDDTVRFAIEVARAIAGFKGGLEGPAIYQDNTIIRRDLGEEKIEELLEKHRLPDGNLDMRMLGEMQAKVGGFEEFFIKQSRFSAQAEYRFLWSVNGTADDYVDLKVPQALNYCRRIR